MRPGFQVGPVDRDRCGRLLLVRRDRRLYQGVDYMGEGVARPAGLGAVSEDGFEEPEGPFDLAVGELVRSGGPVDVDTEAAQVGP